MQRTERAALAKCAAPYSKHNPKHLECNVLSQKEQTRCCCSSRAVHQTDTLQCNKANLLSGWKL